MEAAKAAGAEFADIRVGIARSVAVWPPWPPAMSFTVGYGIRARVHGTWGFQHGSVLTTDAVTTAARGAVAGAARYAATNRRLAAHASASTRRPFLTDLAPTPVVTGEWSVPFEIDPFAVSLDDYYRVIGTLANTTARVHRNGNIRCLGLGWEDETRIFASTDGSLVTQYTLRDMQETKGGTNLPDDLGGGVKIDLPTRDLPTRGFELALRQDTVDYLLTGMEEAVRLRELPFRPFDDLGRYPIVFDGASFANIFGVTASQALDGDRVAGIEADASGTTFLMPPEEILGAANPIFSPLLSARADRSIPSSMAVQWDDEGIVPEPYTIIDHGRVVDYHTTRETAPLLADWYAKHGRPMRAHGGAVAAMVTNVPVGSAGHVHVAPATDALSVYDLARDLNHGFIVRGGHASANAGLDLATMNDGFVLEIKRGQPVARSRLDMLQFATKPILKEKLVALGGSNSIRTAVLGTDKGVPWHRVPSQVSAPAALCKDVDVVSWVLRS